MAVRMRSALRITRTSRFAWPSHLPPFAMWPAFPAPDYYGGSDAVGLAPRRRSRFPTVLDVLACRRCAVRVLEWPRWPSPVGLKVGAAYATPPDSDGSAPDVVVGGCGIPSLGTGLRAIEPSP